METIRLLIVDDHPLFRAGVRESIERTDRDIAVVGEASDGQEAIDLVPSLSPHVILMDIAMPNMNGIEATRRIKEGWPDVSVITLTVYDDEQYIFALLEAGAAGYILKTAGGAEICRAIRQTYEGESVLSPSVARKVLTRFVARRSDAGSTHAWGLLSEREQKVLRLAARGDGNKEIAHELGLSASTVHGHMSHIFDKLGVASRTEAVVCGLRDGWLRLEDLH